MSSITVISVGNIDSQVVLRTVNKYFVMITVSYVLIIEVPIKLGQTLIIR